MRVVPQAESLNGNGHTRRVHLAENTIDNFSDNFFTNGRASDADFNCASLAVVTKREECIDGR